MKILANDGIDAAGKKALEQLGFIVSVDKVSQGDLAAFLHGEGYIGLLVRSATTARKDLIDACPGLKFIGRGGVGIDNIDAEYARSKGVAVFNTPNSSSQAVAELVISLMFAAARGIYDAGKHMPGQGSSEFDALKKKYAKGFELRGKTLGIIGFGRIGQSLASYALGCGMKVVFNDNNVGEGVDLKLEIAGAGEILVRVPRRSFTDLLRESDFISLHVPKQADGNSVITTSEFQRMKKGVVIINTSRGGVIDENQLMQQLDSGHVRYAALDVFVGEPVPAETLLRHPQIISTPHIGASTTEAQERIGLEIADKVKEIMGL